MKTISEVARGLANNIKPDGASYAEVLLAATLAALDDWQASVEERLRRNELCGVCGALSPRPLTGVALTCMLPPGHAGPHSDRSEPLPMLWGGAAEFGTLPRKPFRIQDGGPSRYDAEPGESEE